jgi:hypothetical protein
MPARHVCLSLIFTILMTATTLTQARVPQNNGVRTQRLFAHSMGTSKAAMRSQIPQTSGLSFAPAVTYGSGASYASAVTVADVNGDGKPDVVVANDSGGLNGSGDGSLGVLLGNGDGTFQTAVIYDSGGFQANAVTVADVN